MTAVSPIHAVLPDGDVAARVAAAPEGMSRYAVALGQLLHSIPAAASAFEYGDIQTLRVELAKALGAVTAISPFQGGTS